MSGESTDDQKKRRWSDGGDKEKSKSSKKASSTKKIKVEPAEDGKSSRSPAVKTENGVKQESKKENESAEALADALDKAKAAARIQAQIQAKINQMKQIRQKPGVTAASSSGLFTKGLGVQKGASSATTKSESGSGSSGSEGRFSAPVKVEQTRTALPPSSKIGRGGPASLIGQATKQWKPLLLDKEGRAVDEAGNVLSHQVHKPESSFKVNQKLGTHDPLAGRRGPPPPPEKRQKTVVIGEIEIPAVRTQAVDAKSKYYDHRVAAALAVAVDRKRRSFNFVKPGKYIRKAQTMRMQQISHQMRNIKYEEGSLIMGVDQIVPQGLDEEVPDVEWWDEPVVKDRSYYYLGDRDHTVSIMKDVDCSANISYEELSNTIHHPLPLAPLAEPPPPPPMPLMLTKREKKKIKRMRKIEKQKDQQDKIRFGLMPAPEPRMKLTNIMSVLGEEAVSDPSTAEAKVRKQMKDRKTKHDAHNDSRRLTGDQKRDKLRRKLQEDTSIQTYVALFRCGDLTDSQRRFKVDVTAQQYNLTGCVLLFSNCNVLIAEGGPRGIRKLKRLLLHRIKWGVGDTEVKDASSDEDEKDEAGGGGDSDDEDNKKKTKASGTEGEAEASSEKPKPSANKFGKCVLAWEGVLARRHFKAFRFENVRSEALARKFLADKGCPHYWDMAKNFTAELH